jgi:D-amino-acid dehydrogenase
MVVMPGREAEVLVIGGGIIGASCAYYLARDGRAVTLIEREDAVCPVGASSYANAGLVMPSDPVPLASPGVLGQGMKWLFDSASPLYIKPRLSPALVRWLLGFAAASREAPMKRGMPVLRALGVEGLKAFDEICASGALDAGYKHTGILSLYLSEKALEGAAAGAEPMKREFGVEAQVWDAAAVHDRVPAALPDVVGGVYTAEDGHVDPRALTRGLARMAEEAGATVLTATEALGFTRERRRITGVMTTNGMMRAGTVVLAAGVWSRRLARGLGVPLPLEPAKGYSVTVRRPDGVPDDLALYLPEGHACVTPFGDGLRFAGTLELSGMNDRVLTNRVAAIRRGAGRYFAGAEAAPPVALWRGLRPMSPDGLPMIGRPKKYDNLVVATGHCMNGINYGPITGKLVAEVVAGRTPSVDLARLTPDRYGIV